MPRRIRPHAPNPHECTIYSGSNLRSSPPPTDWHCYCSGPRHLPPWNDDGDASVAIDRGRCIDCPDDSFGGIRGSDDGGRPCRWDVLRRVLMGVVDAVFVKVHFYLFELKGWSVLDLKKAWRIVL
eukprot:scaffold112916_cov76-Cyclotella_meneghiniana.AAC.8